MELEGRPDLAERLKDAIPAATLIALRPAPASGHPDEVLPDEVLVVERSRELAFAGGMIAFPGGRVEHRKVPALVQQCAWQHKQCSCVPAVPRRIVHKISKY